MNARNTLDWIIDQLRAGIVELERERAVALAEVKPAGRNRMANPKQCCPCCGNRYENGGGCDCERNIRHIIEMKASQRADLAYAKEALGTQDIPNIRDALVLLKSQCDNWHSSFAACTKELSQARIDAASVTLLEVERNELLAEVKRLRNIWVSNDPRSKASR